MTEERLCAVPKWDDRDPYSAAYRGTAAYGSPLEPALGPAKPDPGAGTTAEIWEMPGQARP
jgi:hypothetical protein